MADDISTTLVESQPQGALATPIYVRRDVMHWAVTDHELRSLSFLNTLVAICASIASFLMAVAVSIGVALVIDDEAGDVTASMAIVAGIVAALSCGGFLLAYHAVQARNAELDAIRSPVPKSASDKEGSPIE